MARLFISHSSRNNDKAIEVRDWLAANGWDDVFLDLDPERGIIAGQRWKQALQQAASRCEVVLALVSAEWLASSYCKAEINTAQMMGKKTIIALIDKSQVPGDLTDEQFIDLSGDPQAYRRLKKGLELAGLDPLSFPFEAGRRPYPGFAYFEEQDVAVFFGRDAQIVRGLDELRRLVRTGVSRMLVILGASGSGKSSFLRAGLWPRLKRDDRAWLPLPIIRPERAVISGTYGLAGALQQIINDTRFAPGIRQRGLPRSRADIEDFIKTEDRLVELFDALRDIGQVPGLSGENTSPPTIVLALDQGEELFNEEGRDEAERFVEILTRTLKVDQHTLAILAMRSDSFPLVQAHPSLAALPKDTFTLDMMLEGSYRAVIEDPARLIQPTPLRIDPQLTDALLEDISGQDALPLLAFTLAHLYENYAADNELTLAGYDKLGHVKGVIDTAVKQAFAAGVAKGELPKDAKAQLALARAAFIPHLAQVNSAGQFVRRVATFDEIPAEAGPLIDSFAEQRLLIKDRRKDADGKDVDVVEVAHEALLRQPPFSEWLEEDREFLSGKQQLQNDLRDWQEAKPADKNGALLTGLKLSRMRAWLAARPQDLTPQERDFGQASVAQATAEERCEARRRRIITRASIAAAVVLACFAVAAGWQWKVAEHQTQVAIQAKDQADKNSKQADAAANLAIQERDLARFAADTTKRVSGAAFAKAAELASLTEKAVTSNSPSDRAEAYDQFALYHNDAGDWERANRALREAGDLLSGSSGHVVGAHHHETAGDLQWGDSSAALREYAAALTLLDGSDHLATERARLLRKMAGASVNQGKLDEAAQKITEATGVLKGEPTSPERAFLLYVSGQIEVARHNDSAAIKDFQRAATRFEDVLGESHRDLLAGLGLGQTLQMMGDAERRKGLAHAYDSYNQAIRSLEPVLADDPTLLDALRSTELARRGLRLLSMADKTDAAREALLDRAKSDFEAAFGEGIGKFRFGMTIADANHLLKPPFNQATLSNLPRAWEYKTSDVRYFCRWFGNGPPKGVGCGAGIKAEDLTLSLFPKGLSCMLDNGYAVFMFSENILFRIVARFFRSADPCPERLESIDEFARRYRIIASGGYGTRRLRYEAGKIGVVAISDDDVVAFDFEQR